MADQLLTHPQSMDEVVVRGLPHDKYRHVGLGTLALYRRIDELANQGFEPAVVEDILMVASQMRFFIVGNTTASLSKMTEAYERISNLQNEELRHLLSFCIEIVTSIINMDSATNPVEAERIHLLMLFNGLEIAGLYKVDENEQLEQVLEEQ